MGKANKMISEKKKFIFIHIPKTAGSSITDSLKHYSDDNITEKTPHGSKSLGVTFPDYTDLWKHSMLTDYSRNIDINKYFKFTCVRNTWDRLMSWYFWQKTRKLENFNNNSFKVFIKNIKPANDRVFNSQLNYISIEGKPMIDYVIKYDNLSKDFHQLCKLLNMQPTPLQRINESNNSKADYRDLYSNDNKDLVYKMFQDEINYFKFIF